MGSTNDLAGINTNSVASYTYDVFGAVPSPTGGSTVGYDGNTGAEAAPGPTRNTMDERTLLERITFNPRIFGGKPIIRGRRLAVEHVLGMLAAGDSVETILEGYPWLQREDIQACLIYARRVVGQERVEPLLTESAS